MAGPLQEMQNQPMPQPAPPQFAGNSLTDQLMQSMLQRAVQFPQQLQEQQARENQALTDYQNALRTAGCANRKSPSI
jgi:hypothetical protein